MNGRPALGAAPAFVAQQVHVNSRLLIADDRHCILGSAALNDRCVRAWALSCVAAGSSQLS